MTVAIYLLLGTPAFAQVPAANQFMAFEGTLVDNFGEPVDLSGQSLSFYISAGGCYLFGETISTAGDSQGQIVHRFGNGTILGTSPNTFSQNLFFGDVSGTTSVNAACTASAGTTRSAEVYYQALDLRGTMILGTVPYAQNATMLDGKRANSFVEANANTATVFSGGTTGQYLTKSASGLTWTSLASGQISGLGNLATKNSIDLSTAEATGTLAAARLPSFSGDIATGAGSSTTTLQAIRGIPLSATAPTIGQVLAYNGFNWAPTAVSNTVVGGTGVTSVTSANGDISVSSSTVAPVLTLNTGTAANQILKLDSGARIPAVDASQLNFNATQLVSGTLPTARLPAFAGDISNTTGSNTLTVSSLRGYSVSTTAPTSGQVLKYNGTTWVASADLTGGAGGLLAANNLSDVGSSTTARTNLGITALATKSFINLTSDVSGVLPLANGGSKWTGVASGVSGIAYVSGNVGIGTSSPGVPLHILSNTATTQLSVNSSGATRASIDINNQAGGQQSIFELKDAGTIKWQIGKQSDNSFFIYDAAYAKNIISSASGSLTLQPASGNVGIGIATPSARLHIASGTAAIAPLRIASGTLLTTPVAGSIESDGANIYFTDGSNVRRALSTTIVTSGGTTGIDDASSIDGSNNIVLAPSGNSVIVSATTASTNANTGALIVKGGLGVNGSAYYTGSIYTAGSISASGTISSVNLQASGNIKSTGNIYTSGSVVVSGAVQASGNISTTGNIISTGNITAPTFYGSANSGGSLTLDSTSHATKGNLIIGASGTAVMIGGSTAATTKFDIKSNNANAWTSAYIPTTGSSVLRTGEDSGNSFWTQYWDSAGTLRIQIAASATNFIRNNVVVGGQNEIPGNNVLSVHGTAAISGSLSVSRTVVLGGGTAYVPLMFTSATIIATPVPGALEYDGSDFLFTASGSQRRRIAGGGTAGSIDNVFKIGYSSSDLALSGNTTGSNAAVTISNNNVLGTVALFVGQNMVVSGSIKLSGESLDSATTCTANDEGKQRYNKTLKAMEFCNGSYWRGMHGVTTCPTIAGGVSFTLVGVAGTGDAFCITKDHWPTVSYYDAIDQCALKATVTGAKSRICNETELNLACKAYSSLGEAGLPNFSSGTTKYWIPADDNAYALDYTVNAGASTCSTNSTATSTSRTDTTTLNSYRCCYQ